MENFNFKRFCLAFRWLLVSNRILLLAWFGSVAVGTVVGGLLFIKMTHGDYTHAVRQLSMLFCLFFAIGIGVSLSTFLQDVNQKKYRQTLLTLPATHLEKWLAAMLYATVCWTVVCLLAFLLGDLLRTLLEKQLLQQPGLPVIPEFFENITPNALTREHIWWTELLFISAHVVWCHSFYILGGTLLRRNAFAINTAGLILLAMAEGYLFSLLNGGSYTLFNYTQWAGANGIETYHYANPLVYVITLALTGLSAFNYRASFTLFRNYQLATNKWVNYDIQQR